MAHTQQKTECSFIPTVTSKSTAKVYTLRSRVQSNGRNERLELLDAKASRAVLRGGNTSNGILLPDTDVKDAEWMADLLQHGLLRPRFIPPAPQRELRDLTRYRSSLVADRARVINRLQKVWEDTNLKLASVVTDVTGVSARAILRAYLNGETDPWELANLARGSLRGKQVQVARAMVGTVKAHHRFLLLQQIALIETLEQQIAAFDQEISDRIGRTEKESEESQPPSQEQQPIPEVGSEQAKDPSSFPVARQGLEGYAKALERLDGITGVNRRVAEIVLAEIGINMDQFPSDGHLASWAGMVRCITRLNIPGAARKNSKGGSWVNGLPHVERSWGTVACH